MHARTCALPTAPVGRRGRAAGRRRPSMLSSVQSWLEGAAAADPKGLVLQAEAATRDPGYKLRRQQMIGSCQIAGRGRDALGDTSFLPRTRERRTICVSDVPSRAKQTTGSFRCGGVSAALAALIRR